MSATLRKRNVAFHEKVGKDLNDVSDCSESNKKKGINGNSYPSPARPISKIGTKIDSLLQAYVKFTSSAFNQERFLKLAQYSLFMISRFYGNNNAMKDGLVHVSGQISWARYINRFFGLPAALEGIRSGSWGNPKALGKALAWTMVGYYPLEHLAYLKWQAPKAILPNTSINRLASKASAVSCQFWFAYIVLDIIRSALALRKKDDDSGSTSPESRRNERLQIIRNALFAPTAVHYGLPNWDVNPLLSDFAVNFLFWLESIVCMYQGIANFQ